MSSKYKRGVSFIICLIMILSFSGCDFKTTVVSNAESPETTVNRFFELMKQKNFDECDGMLTDNATIKVTSDTNRRFTEALIDFYMDNLLYEIVGKAEQNGINASQTVKITTADKSVFRNWLNENKNKIEKKFLKESGKTAMDHQDENEVDELLTYALQLYSENVQLTTSTINLSLILVDDQWKIIGSQELAQAIYGGFSDEKQ